MGECEQQETGKAPGLAPFRSQIYEHPVFLAAKRIHGDVGLSLQVKSKVSGANLRLQGASEAASQLMERRLLPSF